MSLFGPPSPEKQTKRLFKAIENHSMTRMVELIDAGVSIHETGRKNSQHFTPLYACLYHDFYKGAEYLIEKGVDLNVRREYDGQTMLMKCAREGAYGLVEKMINAGADIHAVQTDDGKSALHLAAQYGRADVVKLLLRHGAQIDLPDNRMNTPADLADKDHPRLADFLRAQMAPPMPQEPKADGWRLTARDEVAKVEDKPAINYRITEIFNFGAGVYSRITRNLTTDQESHSMRLFEELQGSQMLEQAAEMYTRLGGDPQKRGAADGLGKKPASISAPVSSPSAGR